MPESVMFSRRSAVRMLGVTCLLVGVPAAAVGGLFFRADAATLSSFSRMLAMSVDLANCSLPFARAVAAATSLSVALGAVCLVLLVWCLADIYTYKRAFKPYWRSLVFALAFTLFLLLPLVLSDGTWMIGRRGARRFELPEACLASHEVFFLRAYVIPFLIVMIAWVTILVVLIARRQVILNRSPDDLSEDPAIREFQLRYRAQAAEHARKAKRTLRIICSAFAGLIFVFAAATLPFSVSRSLHQITWERQALTVVESSNECILELRLRGRWQEHSRSDCPTEASRSAFERSAAVEAGKTPYRVTFKPTTVAEYQTRDKQKVRFELKGHFFLTDSNAVGSQIVVLRNPVNPLEIDRLFDNRETLKICLRLLLVAASAAVIFFLWPSLRTGRSIFAR
jgi:hypothetical protein